MSLTARTGISPLGRGGGTFGTGTFRADGVDFGVDFGVATGDDLDTASAAAADVARERRLIGPRTGIRSTKTQPT